MPRRDYQDFSQWDDFGTRAFWQEVVENPALTGEIVVQRLVFVFGLVNPSEKCSARIAAGIATAQHGPACGSWITNEDMDSIFHWVKVPPPSVFPPHLRYLHACPPYSLPTCGRGNNRDSPPCSLPTCGRGHNRDSSILDFACRCDMLVFYASQRSQPPRCTSLHACAPPLPTGACEAIG